MRWRSLALALALPALLAGCEHEGPNQIDGRYDGPPRDAHAPDAPDDDAPPPPDARPPDARPPDAPATDAG